MNNAETYAKIGDAVAYEARRWARAWPHIPADDFAQHGWLVVLEALPTYDATRAKLQTFVSRICERAFLNYAYQQTLPVHAPKKNEHRFAHLAKAAGAKARDAAIEAAVADQDLERVVDRAYTREAVREAVEVVAAEFAERLTRLKQHRGRKAVAANRGAMISLLLSETTASTLAAKTGTKATTWHQRTNAAREQLRLQLSDYRGQA